MQSSPTGSPSRAAALLQEQAVVVWSCPAGHWRVGQLHSLWICPHCPCCSTRMCIYHRKPTYGDNRTLPLSEENQHLTNLCVAPLHLSLKALNCIPCSKWTFPIIFFNLNGNSHAVVIDSSAFISVIFLKKTMRAADILGGALAVVGTYLLVTFAPNVSQQLTARQVQNDLVSWPFLVYVILEIIIFCILLYFYKRKAVKHIVVLLMMVALLASLTVIAVKAVASMIILSAKGKMQLTYPVFYIMLILMATSCVFQVKFLNQALHLYEARAVVPINFVFCTTSAIISGVIFYQEFQSAAFLSVFMFLFGCLLSFLSVFVIAVNKNEERLQVPYIDCGCIPGQKLTGKIQPDSYGSCYGTLNNKDDSGKSQS
uniref:NIPA like domain containing 2 n=2 Tax=Gallus gallus TaxID=9031 RepID=A0A8V0YEC3_CHICK